MACKPLYHVSLKIEHVYFRVAILGEHTGYFLAVGRNRHVQHKAPMSFQFDPGLAGLGIPDADQVIGSGGDKPAIVVAGELNLMADAFVVLELLELTSGANVPESQGPVVAASDRP